MKQIPYAGHSILTSDEIARVLLEYTAALARNQLAEAIEVPILSSEGWTLQTAEMVVGIGSDLLATPVEFEAQEPDFTSQVVLLREKLDRLTQPVAVVVPKEVIPLTTMDDFDI